MPAKMVQNYGAALGMRRVRKTTSTQSFGAINQQKAIIQITTTAT
jgi:hypothetical protein